MALPFRTLKKSDSLQSYIRKQNTAVADIFRNGFFENVSPSVALNSPADAGTTTDTTPTLDFTGTDSEGNDVSYEVQIDTVNTFDGAYDNIARVQSKKEISASSVSFDTTPTAGNLVVVAISRYNDISSSEVSDNQGNTYHFIRKHSGGPGADTVALFYAYNIAASGTFTVSYAGSGTISIHEYSGVENAADPLDKQNSATGTGTTPDSGNVTTTEDGELFFSAAWSIQNGDSWAANNGFTLRENETDNNTYERHATADKVGNAQTTSGNFTVSTSSAWIAVVATFKRRTYTLLDKLSASDSGFANTVSGGDTNPFNSGEKVSFTVQAGDALAAGTYYWRARAKDPSGSNQWGAWSSTRSFIVAVAKNITDSGAGSDSISVSTGGGPTPVNITDSGSGADALTLKAFIALADSGLGTDSFLILAKVPITDLGAGVETISIKNFLAILDSGIGNDLISILAKLNLTDTGSGSDTLAVAIRIAQTDTGSATDALSVKAFLTIADIGTAIDALSILARMTLSDAGTGADLAVVKALLAQTDAGSGGDNIIVIPRVPISDAGAASDAIGIKAFITLLETAVGADSLSILARLSILDIGTGTETVTPRPRLTITDAGTAVDAIALASRINITDFATGAEVLQIAAYLQILDSGVGNDLISILNRLAVIDNASGSDQLAVAKQLLIMESGVGTDAISFLTTILISDNGVAVENVVKLWVRIYSRITGKYDRITGKFTRSSSPYSATNKYSKQSTPYIPKN